LGEWHSESWLSKAPVESLEQHVKDWSPYVQNIVATLKNTAEGGEIMKQALYVRAPIEKWYEGGVVMIGDSVHSTLPHQGQGCCMAVESAAALAVLLKNAKDTDTPEIVFQKYKELRKPRTDKITETSATAGRKVLSSDPDSIGQEDFTHEKIKQNWHWIEEYDVLEAVQTML
jgi:salicylate hydroxylase